VFRNVTVAEDFNGRGDWATNHGGQYYAVGVGGGVTGRRAHGALLDDLVKDRHEADSMTKRETVWDWYKTALRTRLRKNGWIVFVNTRWHEDDPAGRILPENWSGQSGWVTARDGEDWFVIRLPAIAEENDQLGREPGEPLWSAEKTLKALEQERTTLGTRDWNALYQQYPTTEEGAILKAAYWRKWPNKNPPVVEYIVQSIDGAFEEDEESDYSARTTWAVFDIFNQDNAKILQALMQGKKRSELQRYHAILLEAWRGKVPFSAFKRIVIDGFKEYEPDRLLIEKKASGHSLIQELRKGSLPVKAVSPDRSKKSRAHAAEVTFEQGCVWYMDLPWLQPVIRECAQFPNGEYDDWVDTVTQAIIWLRKTYHLEFRDEEDDTPPLPTKEKRAIYG
jgi:predicted phage terminase large subunit-like protein